MKYIARFNGSKKIFLNGYVTFENHIESTIKYSGTDFEISYNELSDLLIDITDEFPDIDWWVDSSHNSNIIKICKNSFIVKLDSRDLKSIGYIEPGIFKILKNINAQLEAYDLYISNSDFAEYVDYEYEIIISKIGTKPVEKIHEIKNI